jgi:LysM repeat protein
MPLTVEQGAMYVECKLNAQGGKCSAIFEPGALNQLLRSSDGLPRKINMLCHNAMQAAFYASDRKVSLKLARKIAAKYDESVGRRRRLRARILLMPAVFASGALASVVALGFFYPNLIPRWLRQTPHTERVPATSTASEAPARESAPPVGHHARSNVKRDAGNSLVSHSPDLRAAQSVGSAIPVSATGAISAPPIAEEPILPAMHHESAEAKPISDGPEQQRHQIVVREGDTLEKIAVQYLGSEDAMRELVKANPQLSDINQLTVGQLIYLPAGVDPKAPSRQTTATQPLTEAYPQ